MKLRREWLELDETPSTQDEAAALLQADRSSIGVVFTHHQSAGRGRFDRKWISRRGDSLTMSLIFWDYADSPQPWLVGMASAVAAAQAVGCHVRWPNDLSFYERKAGGILTELLPDSDGRRIPVVGIGMNLRQTEFPPGLSQATSVYKETGTLLAPDQVAVAVVREIESLPEPKNWKAIEPLWQKLDKTVGKMYKLPDGREGMAVGVGPNGELRCRIGGEEQLVYAADALFPVPITSQR